MHKNHRHYSIIHSILWPCQLWGGHERCCSRQSPPPWFLSGLVLQFWQILTGAVFDVLCPALSSVCLCTFLPPGCPAGWSLTGCHSWWGGKTTVSSSFLLLEVALVLQWAWSSGVRWDRWSCVQSKTWRGLQEHFILKAWIFFCFHCESQAFASIEQDWGDKCFIKLQFGWKVDVSALPQFAKLHHCCYGKSLPHLCLR